MLRTVTTHNYPISYILVYFQIFGTKIKWYLLCNGIVQYNKKHLARKVAARRTFAALYIKNAYSSLVRIKTNFVLVYNHIYIYIIVTYLAFRLLIGNTQQIATYIECIRCIRVNCNMLCSRIFIINMALTRADVYCCAKNKSATYTFAHICNWLIKYNIFYVITIYTNMSY